MFLHLNTNRWDLHINQPRGESCIKHVCCISRMNFYRSDFKHKIYSLCTRKYGKIMKVNSSVVLYAQQFFTVDCSSFYTSHCIFLF